DQLTMRYPRGVLALDGLSLELEPGLVGLVGANGAGKSTFIKILLGLLKPTSGTVTVLGMDPTSQPIEVRERIGYLPEHDCLPTDVSAADFITHLARMSGLPQASARERAAEMLRHVGLYEARYRLMDGYSTGMKQRVKLAQALVHDPRLLLLDEPTNGLDPSGRDQMLELIRRTGNQFGISVLVSSHLLGEIERVCDHLVAIDGGRLVRSAEIGVFTAQTAALGVEVDHGVDELREWLAGAGAAPEDDGQGGLLVPLGEDERVYDLVRDGASELGLPLVRMQRTRRQLRDLFRSADGRVPLESAGVGAQEEL
ncbi:MAG: ABC transporter ATP-binding protein, partial [Gemmatimonadota bacterium]